MCIRDRYINMLDRQGVYTKVEIASRYEILLDNYIKTIQVEALTAVKMVDVYKRQVWKLCLLLGYLLHLRFP